MRSYGQFCPVAKAAELFCERWTALIIRDLAAGATRFSELKRGVPLMSPTLLSQRLRRLEAEGVVERRQSGRRGGTYHLTPTGAEFVPLIQALGVWGQRWTRRELAEHEIDLGLLLWTLERSAGPDAFGPGRSVVHLTLTDQPAHKAQWWFVNEDGACQLCIDDPGWEVDLYLACTLPDMIRIVRGDLKLVTALDSGLLEALGSRKAQGALGRWLNLSPLAQVESQRPT